MGRGHARGGLLAASLLVCAVAHPAAAQSERPEPSFADKETARSLFEDGDRKYRAGDYKGALAAFEAADEIMGVPTTGVERGRTLAKLGRLLEAREVLLRVTRFPTAPAETPVFARARREAAVLAREVAERIPSLSIQISGLAEDTEFELLVDGSAVPTKARRFPRKVDPGQHTVEVRAEGYQTEKRTVSAREGESVDVQIAMQATAAPNSDTPPSDVGPLGIPIMSWVGFSVGAAGLIIGAVAGGVTLSNVSDLDERCPSRDACPPDVQEDLDEAEAISHLSTAGFIIGGLGIAVGLTGLFLFGPLKVGQDARVQPWVGLASAGLRGAF